MVDTDFTSITELYWQGMISGYNQLNDYISWNFTR